ncbi:MAG: heat-inducible transcriptional repressor HrcA [Holosporales bacterium]|jgi:heat-inducible transcriptional repressor|nr:heat-inducible transcriptional repressor HrcA [Holosporales bacterium]
MIYLSDIDKRAQEVFKRLVDMYIETGEPVGSKTLSESIGITLSPATIRNVMSDLEEAGLLYAPHVSAGRVPTNEGLQMFVHALLEVGNLTIDERESIEHKTLIIGKSVPDILEEIAHSLSGLTKCASLVIAPKGDSNLKHIEFVYLAPRRALIVIVTSDGLVENRVIETPAEITPSILNEASNFLNHIITDRTLIEVQWLVQNGIEAQREHLNELTMRVLESGLAVKSHTSYNNECYIVRGRSNLLNNVQKADELEQMRQLFNTLETRETIKQLLDLVVAAEGVQIFIGSENSLFNISGCSVIIAPCVVPGSKMIGAVGVVGPSRINYGRIIPLVDFTARIVEKMF